MISIIDITQTNAVVMQDLAYRHVFGHPVENNDRGVMRALISEKFHNNEVTAKNLTAAVALTLDVSEPIARNRIARACDLSYVEYKIDESNETRKLFSFPPAVRVKLKEVGALLMQVSEVIKAQLTNPTEDRAGAELVPEAVYFNVALPECKEMYRKRIKEKIQKFKKGRNKKGDKKHDA